MTKLVIYKAKLAESKDEITEGYIKMPLHEFRKIIRTGDMAQAALLATGNPSHADIAGNVRDALSRGYEILGDKESRGR